MKFLIPDPTLMAKYAARDAINRARASDRVLRLANLLQDVALKHNRRRSGVLAPIYLEQATAIFDDEDARRDLREIIA